MKTFVSAKIHNIRVTDKAVRYHGSVSIDRDLLFQAGIQEYEQVHVINLSNGARWITYALPAGPGQFTLNGGGARLGEVGDVCVVLTYRTEDSYGGAKVVFCDQNNRPVEIVSYAGA